MRLFGGEAFGVSELLRNRFIAVQLFDVGGRGNDQHELVATFFCLADHYEFDAIGGGGEFFKVGFGLRVVGELIVVADVETEMVPGGGDVSGSGDVSESADATGGGNISGSGYFSGGGDALRFKDNGYGQGKQGQREASLSG